jgi:hypothetical protein
MRVRIGKLVLIGEKEPRVKPAEPTSVIAGAPVVPDENPEGVKVRFVRGAVANGKPHDPGDEAVVSAEVAALLVADGKVELLSPMPAQKAKDHPYKAMAASRLMRRMAATAQGFGAVADWVASPLGRHRFDPFRW